MLAAIPLALLDALQQLGAEDILPTNRMAANLLPRADTCKILQFTIGTQKEESCRLLGERTRPNP